MIVLLCLLEKLLIIIIIIIIIIVVIIIIFIIILLCLVGILVWVCWRESVAWCPVWWGGGSGDCHGQISTTRPSWGLQSARNNSQVCTRLRSQSSSSTIKLIFIFTSIRSREDPTQGRGLVLCCQFQDCDLIIFREENYVKVRTKPIMKYPSLCILIGAVTSKLSSYFYQSLSTRLQSHHLIK